VNLSEFPFVEPFRPDFMATGPNVVIESEMPLRLSDTKHTEVIDEDEDGPRYKYYESPKILGKLYRAVDEGQILEAIQKAGRSQTARSSSGKDSVLMAVWTNALERSGSVNWQQHIAEAVGIRNECVLTSRGILQRS
jgi:hypothetical protein